ncbi:MAG: HAMP domain-containing protein [Anaerolineales bacterium]|nr:HAMP domain-containing protein [Anaerolineales bacterium]
MKITTRLILSFLLVSILPLGLMGYLELQAMDRFRSLAIEQSVAALQHLGEQAIHQKAVDVARQVDLYLQANPQDLSLPIAEVVTQLSTDQELAAISVQPVGETGYTAVYDQSGVVFFHANPKMVGRNMSELAETLPAFWALYAASLDGSVVASYYEWQDPDGSIRDKYMSCVPVGQTPLRVAATTYIDEFSQPARQTEAVLNALFQAVRLYTLIALVAIGMLALGIALYLAWSISRPIKQITAAAEAVELEQYDDHPLTNTASRRDELGQLARTFQRMAEQVQAREERLKEQVQELRIEIDESKKQRQVEEITETEYFRQLQQKVAWLKSRRTPSDPS